MLYKILMKMYRNKKAMESDQPFWIVDVGFIPDTFENCQILVTKLTAHKFVIYSIVPEDSNEMVC